MAKYPDEIVVLPVVQGRDLAQGILGDVVKAEDHNAGWREIEAIETELGINPKGSDADVRARLDRIDNAISQPKVDQIIAGENITIDPTSGQGVVTINAIVPSAAGQMTVQKVVATDGSGDYSALGGGTVFLRAGIYNISGPINLARNIVLRGDYGGTILYRVGTGYNMISVPSLYDPPANIVVCCLNFDGIDDTSFYDVVCAAGENVRFSFLRWLKPTSYSFAFISGANVNGRNMIVERCSFLPIVTAVDLYQYWAVVRFCSFNCANVSAASNKIINMRSFFTVVDSCFFYDKALNQRGIGVFMDTSNLSVVNNVFHSIYAPVQGADGSNNMFTNNRQVGCYTSYSGYGTGAIGFNIG